MRSTRADGFAVHELLRIVAGAGLASLVVLMAALPAESGPRGPREKDRVIAVVDAMRQAVRRQIVDTGRAAREHLAAPADVADLHELTADAQRAGWRGPYLSPELVESLADGPFVVRIDHDFGLSAGPIDGRFALWTDEGRVEQKTGTYLVIDGVTQSLAREVDREIDGPDADWPRDGRVQWEKLGAGRLIVLLLEHR